jgi:lipopolysaccharide/colanic/teichoic acid biosynthesis glycosyltransferase
MKKKILLIGLNEFIEKFLLTYNSKIKSEKYDIIFTDNIKAYEDKLYSYSKIIYLSNKMNEEIYKLFNNAHRQKKEISYFFRLESINLEYKDDFIFGIPHVDEDNIYNDSILFKSFQSIIALLLLLITLPIIIIVSVLTFILDGLPIFFQQERIGLNEEKFSIHKIRSLKTSTNNYMKSSDKKGSHYTKVGLFLRKSNIDELPQFWNVLNGSMSFIGPRPEMPFIVDEYNYFERLRLKVKPGISGIWQLSKAREKEIHYNLEHDFYYIIKKSKSTDVKIFLKSMISFLK